MKTMKCFGIVAVTTLLFSLSACSLNNSPLSDKSSQSKKIQESRVDYKDQDSWYFESGKMQSPINIDTKKVQPTDKANNNQVTLSINPQVKKVEDNGHAIEVKTTGSATINGRHFMLEQFHIHIPSEHTINGKHYPSEIHFVTKSSDGRIAVISEFVKIGNDNEAIESLERDLSKHNNNKIQSIQSLTPLDMNKYYHYLGSLTTPPLTENVEWYILQTPIQMSKNQLKDLKNYHKGNNRKLQPVNKRIIEVNQ